MTSEILGVAIGVVFVFMLFSLFLSSALEAISAALKLRGRALRVALAKLIADPEAPVQRGGFGLVDAAAAVWASRTTGLLVSLPAAPARREAAPADGEHQPLRFLDVFSHPLVAGGTGAGTPSYVPESHFTSAVLHSLLRDRPEPTIAAVTERVARLPPGPVRTALEGALLDARGDWDALRAGIDRWYANAMNRLSGEYKRFSQLITFVLGLALAAGFNIDAIALARQLYADPIIRAQLADQADRYVNAHAGGLPAAGAASAPDAEAAYRQSLDQWVQARDLLTRTVPGASATAHKPRLERIGDAWLGWVVTALAGMLGAPFWFDLLQKLTNLRGTGPKPASAADGK